MKLNKQVKIIFLILFLTGCANQVQTDSAPNPPWNTTALVAAEDIYEQTVELNNLLGGLVGLGFILILFVISFIVTTANTGNVLSGLVSGSFIAALSSVILLPLQLVGFSVFTITLIMLAASVSARLMIKT